MSTRNLIQVVGGVVAAFFLFAIFALQTDTVEAALRKHKLLPEPERFTELYLENHLRLPKTYVRGGNNSFTFTVHNLEHKPMKYDYVVEAVSTESARFITKGSFELEHDAYKSVKARIASSEAAQRTKINISLENKDQSIHFWVDKAGNQPVD